MTKTKRILSIIITLLFCISVAVQPVMAAEQTQDGVEITLTTDSKTYDLDDNIIVTVTVKNTNSYAITDVLLECAVPDGYELSGTNIKTIETMEAGETSVFNVTLLPKNSEDTIIPDSGSTTPGGDTTTPDDDTTITGNDTITPDDNTTISDQDVVTSAVETKTPHTGDESHIWLWGLGAAVSIIILICVRYKKNFLCRIMSLILCLTMLTSMVPVYDVNAAEISSGTTVVNLSETVTVGEQSVTITGSVSYILPEVEETDSWTITVNGENIELTTQPHVQEDEVYIPLLPVLKALNYEVVWNEGASTLIAIRNGFATRLISGENSGLVAGSQLDSLENTLEVMDRVPYGSAAFMEEIFGAVLTTDTENLKAEVTAEVPPYLNWYDANSFQELGTWTRKDTQTYLQGLSGGSTLEEALDQQHETKPAVLYFTVPKDGNYHLYIEGRDFVDNQPGTRYFNAAIDGVTSTFTFGNHTIDESELSGVTGFYWEDGGVFTLTAGTHTLELFDTSTFFARCNGILIVAEPYGTGSYNPNEDIVSGISQSNAVLKYDFTAMVVETAFPAWATGNMTSVEDTVLIENDSVKLMFYKGSDGEGHTWVQNEIYIDVNGEWALVKERTEELGWLMQSAISSEYRGVDEKWASIVGNEIDNNGTVTTVATVNYFAAGNSTWFIPEDVTKVSDSEVMLTFPVDEKAEITVTYTLDDLVDDPKVTLNAGFKEDGAYSFLLYSGNGVDYEEFERVTAPLLYIKKDMPDEIGAVISDAWMFTPMSTFTYPEGTVTEGLKFTSGVVMDPSCIGVEDQYTYSDTARFGTTFKTLDNQYRNQMVAPMFGTDNCAFKAGDTYSVAYRIVNRNEDWFDTYKYVTQKMYNLTDVRENYYSSLNEAIYNTADMIMDPVYSGWDENAKGFYNMEGSMLVSHSNPLAMVQQYLLTEDEEFLEKRTIPTLAYILSRGKAHFAYDTSIGGATSYAGGIGPSELKNTPVKYGTNVYDALYRMTQGRVPFFLDYALNNVNTGSTASGILSSASMYNIVNESGNEELASLMAESIIKQADTYMQNAIPFQMDTGIVSSFVFTDYVDPLMAFLAAYEITGEEKYLNAAEETGQLLTTSVWTTGYQNDNLTTTTVLNAETTLSCPTNADSSNYDFFWYGDVKWRPGESWEDNSDEVNDNDKSPQELYQLYPEKVTEALNDEIPSWLLAKAGLGTEHKRTPGRGNVITMSSYAGTLEKLAQLTDEDYFETISRSAILGRFSTYAGYYMDRNITYEMKEEWYVDGPDFTNIYWHHLPVFLSILEDYLVNSIYVQSMGNVTFPSTVYNGYAYFHTNHYGFEAGSFYDEDDMWLWLERGIVEMEEDVVNIDYIAARKDGKLGLSFVNEDDADISTTIKLGSEVPGGSSYNGSATVYDASGNKTTLQVTNGSFTLTVPAKGICSVLLNIEGITTPAYAKANGYSLSNTMGETVAEHTDGMSYVLQLTDDKYFAYVYSTRMATEDDNTNGIDKLVMNYSIGNGNSVEVTDECYPFEFIVEVEDPNALFTYTLTGYKDDGTTVNLGGNNLKTLSGSATAPELNVPEDVVNNYIPIENAWTGNNIPAEKMDLENIGYKSSDTVRFVVSTETLAEVTGQKIEENSVRGLRIYARFTSKDGSEVKILNTWITGNEVRNSGTTVLLGASTSDFTPKGKLDELWDVEFAIGTKDNTEEDFINALNANGSDVNESEVVIMISNSDVIKGGVAGSGENSQMRLVVAPVEGVEPATLIDKKLVARLVSDEDGSIIWMDTEVVNAEVRSDGNWNVEVDWTDTVPYVKGSYYADNYTIAYAVTDNATETETVKKYIGENYPLADDSIEVIAIISGGDVIKGGVAGSGENSQMRLVVAAVDGVEPATLIDKKLVARLVSDEDGSIIWMETEVVNAEVRSDGNWNVEVDWTDTVPYVKGSYYADKYTIAYAVTDNVTETETVKKYIGENYPLAEATVAAESVTLDKSSLELVVGATATLTVTVAPENATDKTVTWISSDTSVATVADGVVTGVATGTATITATTSNGKTATCAVTVTEATVAVESVTLDKSSLELVVGATATLTATIAPENATDKTVTWISSDTSVATVADGVVTGVAIGTATITATTSNGKTATCAVTITEATVAAESVTLDKSSLELVVGATATLTATVAPDNATDKTVTWTSSGTNVATVVDGVVTGVATGTATITATTSNGKTATCAVTVTEATVAVESVTLDQSSLELVVDNTATLTATVAPNNATDKTVTWTSSDETVATVANGVVTGVKAGTVTITAATSNGLTATCTVTVTEDAVEVICEGDVSKTGVNTSFEGDPMRLVVNAVEGVEPTALIGKKLVARLVNKTDRTVIWMDTMVVNVEVRTDGKWNMEVNWTDTVPQKSGTYYSSNYTIYYVITESTVDTENVVNYIQKK